VTPALSLVASHGLPFSWNSPQSFLLLRKVDDMRIVGGGSAARGNSEEAKEEEASRAACVAIEQKNKSER